MIDKELDLEDSTWSLGTYGLIDIQFEWQDGSVSLSEQDLRAMLKEIEDWRANNVSSR